MLIGTRSVRRWTALPNKAKAVIVTKRLMAGDCAGLDNEPIYVGKTSMAFGEAKKVAE